MLYELSESERQRPGCGEVRQEIGRQTSEQLEYIPAELKVIEHIRVKYACRQCEEHVAIAARPPQPIAKGLPDPGLLAHTVLSKYGDHLPLYRQEDILMRHGVVIRRSTLCDWIAAAADLAEPLYERMGDLVRASRIIHTDDTPVKLLDPLLGKARTARFWACISDAGHPYTVYDFTDSRKRVHAVAGPPHGAVDFELAGRRYGELLDLGLSLGVKPAMEYLGFAQEVNSIAAARAIMTGSGHPQATIVLDPFHDFRGGAGCEEIARLTAAQIAVCHFDDAPASPPAHQQRDPDRVMPGEGIIDLPRFCALLKQIGYTGFVSLELFREDLWQQDPLQVARTGLEKMRRVCEE